MPLVLKHLHTPFQTIIGNFMPNPSILQISKYTLRLFTPNMLLIQEKSFGIELLQVDKFFHKDRDYVLLLMEHGRFVVLKFTTEFKTVSLKYFKEAQFFRINYEIITSQKNNVLLDMCKKNNVDKNQKGFLKINEHKFVIFNLINRVQSKKILFSEIHPDLRNVSDALVLSNFYSFTVCLMYEPNITKYTRAYKFRVMWWSENKIVDDIEICGVPIRLVKMDEIVVVVVEKAVIFVKNGNKLRIATKTEHCEFLVIDGQLFKFDNEKISHFKIRKDNFRVYECIENELEKPIKFTNTDNCTIIKNVPHTNSFTHHENIFVKNIYFSNNLLFYKKTVFALKNKVFRRISIDKLDKDDLILIPHCNFDYKKILNSKNAFCLSRNDESLILTDLKSLKIETSAIAFLKNENLIFYASKNEIKIFDLNLNEIRKKEVQSKKVIFKDSLIYALHENQLKIYDFEFNEINCFAADNFFVNNFLGILNGFELIVLFKNNKKCKFCIYCEKFIDFEEDFCIDDKIKNVFNKDEDGLKCSPKKDENNLMAENELKISFDSKKDDDLIIESNIMIDIAKNEDSNLTIINSPNQSKLINNKENALHSHVQNNLKIEEIQGINDLFAIKVENQVITYKIGEDKIVKLFFQFYDIEEIFVDEENLFGIGKRPFCINKFSLMSTECDFLTENYCIKNGKFYFLKNKFETNSVFVLEKFLNGVQSIIYVQTKKAIFKKEIIEPNEEEQIVLDDRIGADTLRFSISLSNHEIKEKISYMDLIKKSCFDEESIKDNELIFNKNNVKNVLNKNEFILQDSRDEDFLIKDNEEICLHENIIDLDQDKNEVNLNQNNEEINLEKIEDLNESIDKKIENLNKINEELLKLQNKSKFYEGFKINFEDTHEFLQDEFIECAKVLELKEVSSQIYSDFLVVGTAFVKGEDHQFRGRILIFELIAVVPEEGKYWGRRQKLLSFELCKGPVLDFCSIRGNIAACVGTRVLVYEIDRNEGLNAIAFHDMQILSINIRAVKNYFYVTDINNGLYFFYFQTKPFRIHFLAQTPKTPIKNLGILVSKNTAQLVCVGQTNKIFMFDNSMAMFLLKQEFKAGSFTIKSLIDFEINGLYEKLCFRDYFGTSADELKVYVKQFGVLNEFNLMSFEKQDRLLKKCGVGRCAVLRVLSEFD